MELPTILPELGEPVSTKVLDLTELEHASPGEILHAATMLTRIAAEKMSDPATYHEVATFQQEHGADWSGLQGETPPEHETGSDIPEAPAAPANYCDSLPAIGYMLSELERFQDAALVSYARYLEVSMHDQRTYLGTPYKDSAFRDVAQYLVETMRISRYRARKIIKRSTYFAYRPGPLAGEAEAQPVFPELAESFAQGRLPVESADRVIDLDEDLTKYSQKTNQPVERKRLVLAAFEPSMVEAGESSTPDEFTKAKQRWLTTVADWICEDGPSPAEALAKEADNALKMREHADGSATYSMHVTPDASIAFKNFMLHQLDFNGTPVQLDPKVLDLLQILQDGQDTGESEEPKKAATAGELLGAIQHWDTSPDPNQPRAEDADGTPKTAHDLAMIDHMTTGQRMGAILINLLQTMLSLDPADLGGKKAHGISSQLMIVQDIETAYQTLGIGKLPKAARRPAGSEGILPQRLNHPNPDEPDETHRTRRKPGWTPYQSEAVNIGPVSPSDVEILACNSSLVGQIWDGPDTVLQQKRAHRLFTPAQRRAILSRDKGCQAPGCSTPAVHCAIHHIKEWHDGGLTDENNGITLCSHHHAAVHNGKWTIRKHDGLTYFQPAPWLDPTQPLLRNLYWNT